MDPLDKPFKYRLLIDRYYIRVIPNTKLIITVSGTIQLEYWSVVKEKPVFETLLQHSIIPIWEKPLICDEGDYGN